MSVVVSPGVGVGGDVGDDGVGGDRRGVCANATEPQFVTILTGQRDHATERNQTDRATLFTGLLNNLDKPH